MVLPAPLGPITTQRSDSSISQEMLSIKVEPPRTMLTPASSTTAAMTQTYSFALGDSGGLSSASLASDAIKPRAHGWQVSGHFPERTARQPANRVSLAPPDTVSLASEAIKLGGWSRCPRSG